LEVLIMKKNGLMDIWRGRLNEYSQSGLSVKAWCIRRGFSIHKFYYWRNRISQENNNNLVTPSTPSSGMQSWIPVDIIDTVQPPQAPGGVSIRVAGAVIEVQTSFDPDHLRAVVLALGANQC
jgi:hypothetical protein